MVLISNDFPYSGISVIQNSVIFLGVIQNAESGLDFEWLLKIRTKNTPFKFKPTGVKNSNGPAVPFNIATQWSEFFFVWAKNAQISSPKVMFLPPCVRYNGDLKSDHLQSRMVQF